MVFSRVHDGSTSARSSASSSPARSRCSISCRWSATTWRATSGSTTTRCTGSASRSASRDQRHQARQPQRRGQARLRRVRDRDARRTSPELTIRVRDQGEGFDPGDGRRSAGARNLLKSSGRGIFLIRNFMDDVQLQRAPEGGMEIRMIKRVPAERRRRPSLSAVTTRSFSPPPSRRSSAPATCRWRTSAATSAIDKKGTIDLVTEVDVAVERMFRALIAERFPDHQVLAEELGGSAERAGRARAGCSIRSTAPPTSRTACRSSAPRSRSRSTASPRWPRSTIRTARSCSPPSAAAARS